MGAQEVVALEVVAQEVVAPEVVTPESVTPEVATFSIPVVEELKGAAVEAGDAGSNCCCVPRSEVGSLSAGRGGRVRRRRGGGGGKGRGETVSRLHLLRLAGFQ